MGRRTFDDEILGECKRRRRIMTQKKARVDNKRGKLAESHLARRLYPQTQFIIDNTCTQSCCNCIQKQQNGKILRYIRFAFFTFLLAVLENKLVRLKTLLKKCFVQNRKFWIQRMSSKKPTGQTSFNSLCLKWSCVCFSRLAVTEA